MNTVGNEAREEVGEELVRQAKRLRFAEPELEQRFLDERQAEGLMRSRVTLTLAILYVTFAGFSQAVLDTNRSPEFLSWSLYFRFCVVAPLWMVPLISGMLPGHGRRAEWVHVVATTGVLWGLGLVGLGPGRLPGVVAMMITLDFTMVLLASVVVLPMRLGSLIVMTAAGLAGVLGLTAAVVLDRGILAVAVVNLPLAALVAVALGWGRERNDRVLFAQREHMRRLAEELAASNTELARLNAEKAEFMAIAAHDLRAPLATVRGLAAQLGAGRMAEAEQSGRAHRAIFESSGRMLGLVNAYLGAHAVESGTLEVRLGRVELRAVAEAARARHAGAAEAKGQVLRVECGRMVGARADGALLAQVVDNFATNALKFSPPGAEVRFVVEDGSGRGSGERVRLAVVDAGPGIAMEEQGRLFKHFGRASTRPTGGEASHGLGLALAKRLAEAMGGSVGCESPVTAGGTGARFWVELAADAAAGSGVMTNEQ